MSDTDPHANVTIGDLVDARNSDDSSLADSVRSAFIRKWGQIQEEYYCQADIGAAVLLTAGTSEEPPRVQCVLGEIESDMDSIVLLLDEAYKLEIEIRTNLSRREQASDRMALLEMVWVADNNALALLDATANLPPEERRAARAESSSQFRNPKILFDSTAEYYQRIAQRWAQVFYFRGMVSSVAVLLVAAALSAMAVAIWLPLPERRDVLIAVGTLAAGSVGGVISVMSRMTFEGLELDHTVGARQLFRLGLFRPLIGAAFGMAVLALVAGEVVPLRPTASRRAEVYFYPGLGFLAGFSERFAQDMFSTARGTRKGEAPQPK